MLTVHHLGISQSERIVWLCEELEIPYELIRHERDPTTKLAPATYKALHPFGTAPVITDGDLTLGESGAIMDYIISKYGDGRLRIPSDSPEYAEYLFWFHFANASFMASIMTSIVISMAGLEEGSPVAENLNKRKNKAFAMVEARLGEADYFSGATFSAADIIMLFPLTTMRAFMPMDLTPFPNIRAYLARIAARPAYQRAMKKAEPDMPPMTS